MLNVLDSLENVGVVKQYSKTATLFVTQEEQTMRITAWKNYWSPERVRDVRKKIAVAARKNDLQPSIFEPFFILVESDYEPESLYDAGVLPESMLSNFVEETDGHFMVFTSVLMPIL